VISVTTLVTRLSLVVATSIECVRGQSAGVRKKLFKPRHGGIVRRNEWLVYLEAAVLADRRNALAVGAPLLRGFRIFSPLPFAILLRFAWMFA
jgi:hypothetical protein